MGHRMQRVRYNRMHRVRGTVCASVPPSTVTIRLGLVHVYINKMYVSSVVWTKVTRRCGLSSGPMWVGVTSPRRICSLHVLVASACCMCLLHVLVSCHGGHLILSSKSPLPHQASHPSPHLIKQLTPPCVPISKSPYLTCARERARKSCE